MVVKYVGYVAMRGLYLLEICEESRYVATKCGEGRDIGCMRDEADGDSLVKVIVDIAIVVNEGQVIVRERRVHRAIGGYILRLRANKVEMLVKRLQHAVAITNHGIVIRDREDIPILWAGNS